MALQQPPARRNEAEEAEEVGQHAGSNEHSRRDEDQDAVKHRLGGQPALVKIPPEARQRPEALLPRQRRADNPRAHNEPDGGEGADTLSYFDKQDQFDDRYDDEEKEEASHSAISL